MLYYGLIFVFFRFMGFYIIVFLGANIEKTKEVVPTQPIY